MTASRYISEKRLGPGEYVSLVLYAAAGMALLSSATHLIGLFIALEAFTLAFYILIASNRSSALAAEAGLKYLLLGAVATGFMAFGIALIYAASGSLALPDAVVRLVSESGELQGWGLLGWGMVLVAVGFKRKGVDPRCLSFCVDQRQHVPFKFTDCNHVFTFRASVV